MANAVVIGVGNLLRSDDGVGPAVIRALRERLGASSEVDLVELEQGGLTLAEAMAGYQRAVVVDALDAPSLTPGTLCELALAQGSKSSHGAGTHDAPLHVALAALGELGVRVPTDVRILGVAAKDLFTFREALTEPVSRAVPHAVNRIIESLGLEERRA